MTTKNSPLPALKEQADNIAGLIKRAERGEQIDIRFAERIKAARNNQTFRIAIGMDDKILTIEIPWTTIAETPEAGLAEYILDQMREAPGAQH